MTNMSSINRATASCSLSCDAARTLFALPRSLWIGVHARLCSCATDLVQTGLSEHAQKIDWDTSRSATAPSITGSTQDVTPTSIQDQRGPPQDSILRQPSSREASQQEAAPSQLPHRSNPQQGTSRGSESDRQQQPVELASLQKAAIPSRPERPTSARRGPPKIPQTGSTGKHNLSPLQPASWRCLHACNTNTTNSTCGIT